MTTTHYPSVSAARDNIKLILDAAERGQVVSVERNAHRSAIVDAARLQAFFSTTVAPNAEIRQEDAAWVITMPGRPIAAEASSYEGALTEIIDALREYAADWNERLLTAPNHQHNWGLVQLIAYSTDEQLLAWLTGTPSE